MANDTSTDSSGHTSASTTIAIVLPALFAIVLVILIAIALVLPRLNSSETASSKDERKKKRMARLDKSLKPQHFVDWMSKQNAEHPDTTIAQNPLCVICLEEIEDAANIRGLGCLHPFHQQCLDDWYSRWNEYCPLCHRPIIQSTKAKAQGEVAEEASRETSGRAVSATSMV